MNDCYVAGQAPAAGGRGVPVVWHYNGRAWRQESSDTLSAAPNSDVSLDDVSCWTPRACFAAGTLSDRSGARRGVFMLRRG